MKEQNSKENTPNADVLSDLELIRVEKLHYMTLLFEMSEAYLSEHMIMYSPTHLKSVRAKLDVLRSIVLNA